MIRHRLQQITTRWRHSSASRSSLARWYRSTRTPEQTQWRLLETILHENKDSAFGRKHGFSEIRSLEDWRTRVPVHERQDFQAWVRIQENDSVPGLTQSPALMYLSAEDQDVQNPGLPLVAKGFRQMESEQLMFLRLLGRQFGRVLKGPVVVDQEIAVRHYTTTGEPVGGVRGWWYKNHGERAGLRAFVPQAVNTMDRGKIRTQTLLSLALQQDRLSWLIVPDATSLGQLVQGLREQSHDLLKILESGEIPGLKAISNPLNRAVHRVLHASPRHAARFLAYLEKSGDDITRLWPELRLVVVEEEPEVPEHEAALKWLPDTVSLASAGYWVPELRAGLVWASAGPGCLPLLHHVLFEFLADSDFESGFKYFQQIMGLLPQTLYQLTQRGGVRYDEP